MPAENLQKIETKFLAILINSASARLRYVPELKASDFIDDANAHLFTALAEVFRTKKHTFDLTLLTHYLATNKKTVHVDENYLVHVSSQYVSETFAEKYWKTIREAAFKRRLKKGLSDLERAVDQAQDTSNFMDTAFQKLIDLARSFQTGDENFLSIHSIMQDYLTKQMQHKQENLYCSSGFDGLDSLTGGFKPGELIILAARPSMGKTALGLNMALNNLNTTTAETTGEIIIYSLEMSRQQLAQRVAMIQSPFNDLNKLTSDDGPAVDKYLNKLEDHQIYVNPSSDIDVFKLHSQIAERQKTNPIKLIIIDYLQLLRSSRGSRPETRNLEIGQWTRELKTIAMKLKIPIVCISQLSRNVEKREEKRPLLSDLRDSGSIEQDADLVIFLYREIYYTHRQKDSTESISDPHPAEVIVAKNRNGPIGSVHVMFDPAKTTFTEISD